MSGRFMGTEEKESEYKMRTKSGTERRGGFET